MNEVLVYTSNVIVVEWWFNRRNEDLLEWNKDISVCSSEKIAEKVIALRRGFAAALDWGYTAVITMDVDGQQQSIGSSGVSGSMGKDSWRHYYWKGMHYVVNECSLAKAVSVIHFQISGSKWKQELKQRTLNPVTVCIRCNAWKIFVFHTQIWIRNWSVGA